jgi:uncharacterized YigZ family protein
MYTITKMGHAEQTIQKSRFIAIAQQCNNEREVALFLSQFAAQHTQAHHLAFAYQLKSAEAGIVQRMHDAGEPSGTAGRPILQPIEGMKLVNVCVGVIRYYGGINLGTGGLARAYGGTARMALDNAALIEFVEMQEIMVHLAYAQLDTFIRDVTKVNGKILDKQFGQLVTVTATLPKTATQALIARFQSH